MDSKPPLRISSISSGASNRSKTNTLSICPIQPSLGLSGRKLPKAAVACPGPNPVAEVTATGLSPIVFASVST